MFKTVLIFALLVLAVIVLLPFGLIGIVLSFLGLKRPMSVFTYKIAQGWALMILRLSGCKLTIIGKEKIPKKGGVCFVSNHGSIFDIIIALACIGRPFGFIAKKELIYIPGFNAWISILGGLFIDRKNPRKGLKTINRGIRRLQQGGGILIFPEGHRSRGQGLLPFKPGSFKLATQSGVPVVPVAIKDSYEVFERNYCLNSVPLRITFGVPIKTEELPPENRKQFLAEEVQRIVQAALDAIPPPSA
jgi:1-acyl-sn-glycerol-3-phosphate acyltransferase